MPMIIEKDTVNVNVKTSLIKLVRLYFPEFATMPATHVVDGALRICVTYLTVAKIAETPKKTWTVTQ